MENLIVFIIVATAVGYMVRLFYRQFKGKGGCSPGCSCDAVVKNNCSSSGKTLDHILPRN